MSAISISTPFHKRFVHADFTTVGLTATNYLAAAAPGERRISVMVQNKSTSATVTLILSDTGTSGITLQPNTLFTIDNYNGTVRLAASAANTTVHIAYSLV